MKKFGLTEKLNVNLSVKIITTVLFCSALFVETAAFAVDAAPGAACAVNNARTFSGGPELGGMGYWLVCNGGTWQASISSSVSGASLEVAGQLKLAGAGSVGVYAPTAGNYTMTWPSTPGVSGQTLITSGTGGILSWGTPVATPSFPLQANPQGTAGAPAYSFSTTTNTGMYSTGVGTLAFSTAGTNAMTITNLGRIGIGTTNPNNPLHVVGELTIQEKGQNAKTYISTYSAGVGSGHMQFQADGTNNMIAQFSDCCNGIFAISDTGGVSEFGYDLAVLGKLGVGVASPSAKLHVQGNVRWAGSGSVGIYPPTAGNYTLTWPSHAGTSGQALLTSGTGGILSWGTPVATPSFPLQANPQGTAGAPAYSFSTTTNTGMYSTGVGTLAFSTAGSNRMTIDSSGYIGVGTTAPMTVFSVAPSATTTAIFGQGATGVSLQQNWPNLGFNFYDIGGNKAMSGGYSGGIGLDPGTGTMLFYNTSTSASADAAITVYDRMAIDNSGRVGIGTTVPTSLLQVQGDIKWAGSGSVGIYPPTTGNYTLTWPSHAGTSGQALLTSGTGGILSWGTPVATPSFPLQANPQGTVSAPAYSFSTTTNTGMYSTGVGTLALSTAGTNAVTITNLGRVGIKTASPTAPLDVNGAIAQSGSVVISTTTGAENNYFGQGAGSSNSSTNANTAVGFRALTSVGNEGMNTGIGSRALMTLGGGGYNTGLGANSLADMTGGWYNLALGAHAGDNHGMGSNNIYVGAYAGSGQTAGDSNILIGYGVDAPSLTGSNQLNIGNTIYGNIASGSIGIGTTSTTAKFQVQGNIKWGGAGSVGVYPPTAGNYTLTWPSHAGTSGQALLTSGTGGILSWGTPVATPSFPLLANPQGTAGAPAYSFSTTTNTGMYSTGVGTLAFSTAGTSAMTITNLGRVGIGTATPAVALDVRGDVNISYNNYLNFKNGAGDTTMRVDVGTFDLYHGGGDVLTIASTTGGNPIRLDHWGTGDIDLRVPSGGLLVKNNGSVGIGTTSPTAKLHVQGNIKWAGAGSVGIYPPTAGNYTLRWPNHAGSSGQALVTSGTGGILSWANPTPSFPLLANPQGTAGAPAYSFSTTTNSGIFSPGVGTLAISTAGTQAVTVTNLGYVGIGTAAPQSKLYVREDANTVTGVSVMNADGGATAMAIYGLGNGTDNSWLGMSGTGFGRFVTWTSLAPGGMYLDNWNTSGNIYLRTGGTYPGTPPIERLTVTSAGSVGIGTTGPTEVLHVVGRLRVQGSTDCTLGNGSGATNCTSDIRLKENIVPISNALDKISQITGVEFDWNRDALAPGKHSIGVIAQDVEKVFPTAVIENSSGYKAVDYAVLVSPVIQATKELYGMCKVSQKQLEDLSARVKRSESEIENLKVLNQKLERDNQDLRQRLELIERRLGIQR